MPAAGSIPQPHELIGWEARVSWQLACLLGLVLCSLPLLVDLGLALSPLGLDHLEDWLRSRQARETTGAVAGGIIAFQVSLSGVKRLAGLRRIPFHLWRTAHQVAPLLLVFVLLFHTRGRLGDNLNRWLISVLLAQLFMVQAGHVAKAFIAGHAGNLRFAGLHQLANGKDGFVHRAGLHLHVLLAITVVILLVSHMLSVWYF